MSGTYSDSNRHRIHPNDKRLMNEIDDLEQMVDEIAEERDRYMFLLAGLKAKIHLEIKLDPSNTVLRKLFLHGS